MPAKRKARNLNRASHPYTKPEVKSEVRYSEVLWTMSQAQVHFMLFGYNPHGRPRTKKPSPEPVPSQKNIIVRPLGVETPLEAFFSQYPKFQPEPSNSPIVEFGRLCKSYQWGQEDPEEDVACKAARKAARKAAHKAAREAFQSAMKREFDDLYGSDENDINNWHKLCYVLRIDPAPETLQECRTVSCQFSELLCPCGTKTFSFVQAVLTKHVNLVDLVHGSKEEVRIFETEKELSKYTKKEKKYFPKEDAKDGGVLRALRRRIFSPRDGTTSLTGRKARRGKKRLPIDILIDF
jgi:hypothetical protein